MFIGHYAAALVAKKADPKTNLGVWFFACQFLDTLWPIFVLLGIEHVRVEPGATAINVFDFQSYPYSHSLVMSLVWSAVVGGIFFTVTKRRYFAMLVGLVVFSYWFLDFLSHRPDLPLGISDEGPKVGLGLWYSLPATVVLEVGFFALSVWLFAKGRKVNKWFWSLIAFLFVVYFGHIFGPKPPVEATEADLAAPALALLLLVPWAWKADK